MQYSETETALPILELFQNFNLELSTKRKLWAIIGHLWWFCKVILGAFVFYIAIVSHVDREMLSRYYGDRQ